MVDNRGSPLRGGSADRHERANTFGGSPLERPQTGLNLRATQPPTHESLPDQPTPVLGGEGARVPQADGPESANQEEEEKGSFREGAAAAREEDSQA